MRAYVSLRDIGWTVGRNCLALMVALIACASALDATAQSNCPATDPNQNYNCPVGPKYALPSWGNAPWSLPQYYSSVQLGDLDGNGRDELIGRNGRGFEVWSFDSTLGLWKPWLSSSGTGLSCCL